MSTYTTDFYARRHTRTNYAADAVLEAAFAFLPPIYSAVDLGCGVGTWLSALRARNINDVLGVDGPWVNPELLRIPRESFRRMNLAEGVFLDRRFDIALCLEVAEHLPGASAAVIVESLTTLADFVLFSAAIPGQGGEHHVNEQWPTYWADLFAARGYQTLDVIRPRIWDDREIPVWYRQNLLLYVRETRLPELRLGELPGPGRPRAPLSIVHPEMLETALTPSVRRSLRILREAVGRSLQGTSRKAGQD